MAKVERPLAPFSISKSRVNDEWILEQYDPSRNWYSIVDICGTWQEAMDAINDMNGPLIRHLMDETEDEEEAW